LPYRSKPSLRIVWEPAKKASRRPIGPGTPVAEWRGLWRGRRTANPSGTQGSAMLHWPARTGSGSWQAGPAWSLFASARRTGRNGSVGCGPRPN